MFSEFVREVVRFLVLVFFRPLFKCLAVLSWPVRKILGLFAERRANRTQGEFAREIRRTLPWFFDEYGAQEIPNTRKYPKAFDYVVVTITAEKVLFAFIRGRGELRIDVAPEHAPNDW